MRTLLRCALEKHLIYLENTLASQTPRHTWPRALPRAGRNTRLCGHMASRCPRSIPKAHLLCGHSEGFTHHLQWFSCSTNCIWNATQYFSLKCYTEFGGCTYKYFLYKYQLKIIVFRAVYKIWNRSIKNPEAFSWEYRCSAAWMCIPRPSTSHTVGVGTCGRGAGTPNKRLNKWDLTRLESRIS